MTRDDQRVWANSEVLQNKAMIEKERRARGREKVMKDSDVLSRVY